MDDDRAGAVYRLKSRLEKIRTFSWADRWVLVDGALVLTLVSLALKVASFQRVHGVLLKLASPVEHAKSADHHASRVIRIATLVGISSRHTPLANTCLHRSLTLWWLLNRRGYDGRLQFGARKRDGVFEAHAWVEHGGVVVSEEPGEHDYVRLPWEPLKSDA